MADALGIVSRVARPEQDVDVSVVSGIEPVAEMVMVFDPSLPWLTVFVAVIASTHALSVMVKYSDTLCLSPSIVMEKLPVPRVVKPVLFRL
jgi:hypothetical protein